jgi:hypothetical protein
VTRRKLDLGTELQKIYDSEINVGFSWLWDGGIDVRLGDSVNGYLAEAIVPSVADILPWLQEAIAHFYPESTYAKGLSAEVKARAACRIFLPPTTGARVTCPHCGAPNPNHSGMEEIFSFICSHCGAAVQVKPPKIQ